MLKKLFNLVFICIVITSCASGGGGSLATQTPPPSPPPSASNTPTDDRIAFDEFQRSYNDLYGDVVVTYGMSPFTTEGLPSPTEKFKFADYGFLRITIDGKHNGSNEGAESTQPGPFLNGGYWFEADLNG